MRMILYDLFFFQAEDGIRDIGVTGVQTCALPILSQDPQLYLRVVGDDEPPPSRCRERVPDTGAELRAHRDVLQVRGVAGDTAGRCRRLVQGGMDAAVLPDQTDKTVYVGPLELGELAVGNDAVGDRVLDGELLQDLGVRRVAGLGLPDRRDAHLLEEYLAELLGRADVEGVANLLEDFQLELLDPL